MRWSYSRTNIVLMMGAVTLTVGCRGRDSKAPARAAVAVARDTALSSPDTTVSGGEVIRDSISDSSVTAPAEKWLNDANVLSLLAIMNARQLAAAEIEVEAWHLDTVREFAIAMMHDHAELQRSIDSLIERVNIMPVRPALADQISARFQAQIDSMMAHRGGPRGSLDRAFVLEQISSHGLMASYLAQLAGVAERPELRALLSSAATRVNADRARAQAMQARLAIVDSLATDSGARAAQRNRDTMPR